MFETGDRRFRTLVAAGGEVSAANAEYGARHAAYLFWVTDNKHLRSVMALKQPREDYRTDVFKKAKGWVSPAEFPLEIGYAHTEAAARKKGYARKIIMKAIESAAASGIYATSRADNNSMHKILSENGFIKVGVEYDSTQRDERLVLFVRSPHANRRGSS